MDPRKDTDDAMRLDRSKTSRDARGRPVECDEFRRYHAEYVDGRLDGSLRERVRRHAGECLPCARHDRTVRKGCALVGELPTVRTTDDFTVRLRDRIARDRSRRRRMATTGSLIVPAAGVVAILAVIAAGPLFRAEPDPVELAPVQARAPVSFAPALGAGMHPGGARLYRAATSLPGVWLGDGGVPHRHEAALIYQGARRDPGYPTLFLEPPEFPAEPALLESRVLPVDLR